ncbi:MAG: BrnT family toxin [Wenzhouxiangella sp.]
MRFDWDAAKDRSNQKKHGLSFSEASLLFASGQDYLEIFDLAHSDAEDRFIAIGQLDRGIAVVVYTERDDDLIRIIGARFATKREQEQYRQHMDQRR